MTNKSTWILMFLLVFLVVLYWIIKTPVQKDDTYTLTPLAISERLKAERTKTP